MSALIKVGDVWVDPARVDAIRPARKWSTDVGEWVTDSSSARLWLCGSEADFDVHGVTPDEAAALINAAILGPNPTASPREPELGDVVTANDGLLTRIVGKGWLGDALAHADLGSGRRVGLHTLRLSGAHWKETGNGH